VRFDVDVRRIVKEERDNSLFFSTMDAFRKTANYPLIKHTGGLSMMADRIFNDKLR
jgi:hypothetical protein